ncbi:MAG TPA: type IV secretion system DNA-binding domain-containing protein [Steroidobacteraceae bacterium]
MPTNVITALAAATLLVCWVRLSLRRSGRDFYRRGTMIVHSDVGSRSRLKRQAQPRGAEVTLATIPLTPADETKHFKLIGTTGTGKTTAIGELIDGALRRGDRAIISDPDGGYHRRLYRRYRGDVILNPFESESVQWNPFAEVRDSYDIDQLANALIPHSDDPSTREWRAYARTFLSAVIRSCQRRRTCDLPELWRLLVMASSEELQTIVAGSPAQPFLESHNARMFGSIRSVLMSAIAALEYVKSQRSGTFSIREWVRDGRGVLFIPYRAGQIAALRSIISAWMRLAIVEALSQSENRDQRLWFVIDELDALGAIDGLKDALARLRKFGGRCVLGFQSIAQVSGTYGIGDAQTIVENCGNTLILRCSGSESGGTSQFASRLIGEREVVRRQISRGRDRDVGLIARGSRRSTQTSEQCATEMALLPSELEQLPDLCGYLKLSSSVAWRQVSLRR